MVALLVAKPRARSQSNRANQEGTQRTALTQGFSDLCRQKYVRKSEYPRNRRLWGTTGSSLTQPDEWTSKRDTQLSHLVLNHFKCILLKCRCHVPWHTSLCPSHSVAVVRTGAAEQTHSLVTLFWKESTFWFIGLFSFQKLVKFVGSTSSSDPSQFDLWILSCVSQTELT